MGVGETGAGLRSDTTSSPEHESVAFLRSRKVFKKMVTILSKAFFFNLRALADRTAGSSLLQEGWEGETNKEKSL